MGEESCYFFNIYIYILQGEVECLFWGLWRRKVEAGYRERETERDRQRDRQTERDREKWRKRQKVGKQRSGERGRSEAASLKRKMEKRAF